MSSTNGSQPVLHSCFKLIPCQAELERLAKRKSHSPPLLPKLLSTRVSMKSKVATFWTGKMEERRNEDPDGIKHCTLGL